MGEAIKADVTLALHAKKLGHKMYPGSKLSGKIKIIDRVHTNNFFYDWNTRWNGNSGRIRSV